MPTVNSILADLKKKGSENIRKLYARHGMAADRVYGVKVADLKLVAKTIKGQQPWPASCSRRATWRPCTWREWWPTARS